MDRRIKQMYEWKWGFQPDPTDAADTRVVASMRAWLGTVCVDEAMGPREMFNAWETGALAAGVVGQ